jgi:hypothetical protein
LVFFYTSTLCFLLVSSSFSLLLCLAHHTATGLILEVNFSLFLPITQPPRENLEVFFQKKFW